MQRDSNVHLIVVVELKKNHFAKKEQRREAATYRTIIEVNLDRWMSFVNVFL